jgi:tRNA U34 5-methylaminomethyl-2-thiouridine-forming methyltransferase MnmC
MINLAEKLQCHVHKFRPNPMNRRQLGKHVLFELFIGPFDQQPEPENSYQMILFDPFSPDVNPELWTREVFRKLADWSDPDVLLATYGAASSARAAMAAAGWKVARAPGALGKREMTLAALNPEMLSGWKRVNEDRLRERYESGEFVK